MTVFRRETGNPGHETSFKASPSTTSSTPPPTTVVLSCLSSPCIFTVWVPLSKVASAETIF